MSAKSGFPKVRTMSNTNLKDWADKNGTVFVGPSMAVQSQKDEADINTIVRNFGVTGKLPANVRTPMFGDFTEVGDYRSALEAVRLADESFLAMPSELRAKLDHDPQRFLEWCADKNNLEEMRKLGLAPPGSAPQGSGGAAS